MGCFVFQLNTAEHLSYTHHIPLQGKETSDWSVLNNLPTHSVLFGFLFVFKGPPITVICFGHFFKPTCEENDLRNIPLSRPGCFQCKWIHTQVVANWVTLLKNERELPWKVLRALVYSQFFSKQFNTEGGRQSGACRRVFLSRDRSKYDDSFSLSSDNFF